MTTQCIKLEENVDSRQLIVSKKPSAVCSHKFHFNKEDERELIDIIDDFLDTNADNYVMYLHSLVRYRTLN